MNNNGIGRYSTIATASRYDGKTVLTTTYYPELVPDSTYIYKITSVSDRLDTISVEYYGDPQYWWIIARANNLGKGSLGITPGTQIAIPPKSSLLYILQKFKYDNQ